MCLWQTLRTHLDRAAHKLSLLSSCGRDLHAVALSVLPALCVASWSVLGMANDKCRQMPGRGAGVVRSLAAVRLPWELDGQNTIGPTPETLI